MKIRCTENMVTKGWLFKTNQVVPLTVDKVYSGMAVPITDNVTMSHSTQINPCDIMFFVFDDDGEWNAYPAYLFEPAE